MKSRLWTLFLIGHLGFRPTSTKVPRDLFPFIFHSCLWMITKVLFTRHETVVNRPFWNHLPQCALMNTTLNLWPFDFQSQHAPVARDNSWCQMLGRHIWKEARFAHLHPVRSHKVKGALWHSLLRLPCCRLAGSVANYTGPVCQAS